MHIREFVQHPPNHPFYAVIGHPIGHSKSPLLHNYALKHLGLPGVYYSLDTPSDSFAWVGQLLSLPGFRGLNVTIPHKSHIIDLLQMVDPVAQSIGAVNTVHRGRIGLAGYNTDIAGVEHSLKPFQLRIAMRDAVVLGTGGAARAAVAALRMFSVRKAYVVSRNPAATKWPGFINKVPVEIIGYHQLSDVLHDSAVVINTTPVGMHPDTEKSPFPDANIKLLNKKVCMDAIYNPVETMFLKQAKNAGAHATITGVQMFIHQAAVAFSIWTDATFPVEKAEQKLLQTLQPDVI